MQFAIKSALGALMLAALAWAAHGPAGLGTQFADRLQTRAEVALAEAGGFRTRTSAAVMREPALRRVVILSGPDADDDTRARLVAAVAAVPGVAAARWSSSPPATAGLPLFAETLLLLLGCYGIGLAGGGLLWRRSGQ